MLAAFDEPLLEVVIRQLTGQEVARGVVGCLGERIGREYNIDEIVLRGTFTGHDILIHIGTLLDRSTLDMEEHITAVRIDRIDPILL
jgi:hypothetical protein